MYSPYIIASGRCVVLLVDQVEVGKGRGFCFIVLELELSHKSFT